MKKIIALVSVICLSLVAFSCSKNDDPADNDLFVGTYKGSGLGLIGNIIIGILGSGVGYWLLGNVFHISLGEGWIGAILTGAIGAIVILFLINLVFKKK